MALVSDDLALLGPDARSLLDEVIALGRAADAASHPPRCPDLLDADPPTRLGHRGRSSWSATPTPASPSSRADSPSEPPSPNAPRTVRREPWTSGGADGALARLPAQGEHAAGRLVEPALVEPSRRARRRPGPGGGPSISWPWFTSTASAPAPIAMAGATSKP